MIFNLMLVFFTIKFVLYKLLKTKKWNRKIAIKKRSFQKNKKKIRFVKVRNEYYLY